MRMILGSNLTRGLPLIIVVITVVIAFNYFYFSQYEANQYSGHIKWHDLNGIDYADQPILVNIYMSFPGEEPLMDKYTFRHVKVVDFIESNFFPIRVVLNDSSNVLFMQKYKILGPTVLILKPKTYVEIGRIYGFYPPGKFLKEIDAILKQKGE